MGPFKMLNFVLCKHLNSGIIFFCLEISGWSSRIEIHEQFAEVQDEKLEELTDNLVSCMTGPEGQGGDDQVIILIKIQSENGFI
jgi:hypothetical protein